jgi:hypothetical protein
MQTDTIEGKILINSGEVTTDLENRLVKLADAGSTSEVLLPAAVTDLALFIIEAGAAHDSDAEVVPLDPSKQMLVRANGTGSAGAVLVLCDPTASSGVNAGKVETIPTTQGAYFSPGIAEEDWVDEQLLKFRPCPRIVQVGTAFTVAAPAATAATASTPYGFSEAQANAILTNVIEMRAFMVANKLKATA